LPFSYVVLRAQIEKKFFFLHFVEKLCKTAKDIWSVEAMPTLLGGGGSEIL